MSRATRLIETLELARHPEGGWYRETWRGPPGADGRAVGTAILFLLEADQESHWHKVDASEAWLWHEGDPLLLRLSASDAGPVREILLGGELLEGGAMQAVVVPNEWQAARPAGDGDHGYTLVSCVVAPGFDFAGFTLAEPDWRPGA